MCGRGSGRNQQARRDHIKWNECDWAPGLSRTHRPPTVSGLHHEGRRRRIQKLLAIYRRAFGKPVCVWSCVCVYLNLDESLPSVKLEQ